ncbi:hypothetical protein AAG906_004451 [Vitis piasezkii]
MLVQQICSNPVFHLCMKHVALDSHFIREQVQNGLLRVSHISRLDQLADALTKPLTRPRFDSLKAKIGLAPRHPSCDMIRIYNQVEKGRKSRDFHI